MWWGCEEFLFCGGPVFFGNRSVSASKIQSPGQKLANPPSASNRLVIDGDQRVDFLVFRQPLGVQNVGKRSSCTIDQKAFLVFFKKQEAKTKEKKRIRRKEIYLLSFKADIIFLL